MMFNPELMVMGLGGRERASPIVTIVGVSFCEDQYERPVSRGYTTLKARYTDEGFAYRRHQPKTNPKP